MAAQETAIADIYEPAIWSSYFLEEIVKKSLLIQSGIAGSDMALKEAIASGGFTINMPYWDNLPNSDSVASIVGTDDDTDITPTGLTTSKDIAVKHFRNKAWNTADIVKYAAGSDPVSVLMSRYVTWWVQEEQRLLTKTLAGVFADATVAAALENDIAVEAIADQSDATKISLGAIEDTRFLLGDAYSLFTGMICHSVVYKRLRELNLIDMVPDSDQKLEIPTYNGLRVLVDDTMPTAAGTTDGTKYYTYLFGQNAIGREDIPITDPNVEIYRQPMAGTGSGATNLITRRGFIMHPRGVAFSGTPAGVSPTDAELIDGGNWTKVYDTKNIRIARLVTNG